jgi:hypothetical protein
MNAPFLEGEKLYPVVRAVELATGRRPHKSNVYRWTDARKQQVPLPYVVLGGQRMCSAESVRRWIAEVTAAKSIVQPESRPVRDDAKVARAEQNLTDRGW